MRSLLNLDALSEKHADDANQAIHDVILEEISKSTTQLHDMGSLLCV